MPLTTRLSSARSREADSALDIPTQSRLSWKEVGRIGSGSFATIVSGKIKKADTVFAVKRFKTVDQLPEEEARGQAEWEADIHREIVTMSSLDHINIVKFLGWRQRSSGVTELYMEQHHTDLWNVVNEIDFQERKEVIKDFYHLVINQMLSALEYLASQGLVHCDIKPENILSDRNRQRFYLADFGFAVKQSSRQYLGGTPLYRAPEVWRGILDYTNDVWSLGTVGLFVLNLIPRAMKVEGERQRRKWFRWVEEARREVPIEIRQMLHHDHAGRRPARSITRAQPGRTYPYTAGPGVLSQHELSVQTPPSPQVFTRSRVRQETESLNCDISPMSMMAASASTLRSMSVAQGCHTLSSGRGSRMMEYEPTRRTSPRDRPRIEPVNPLTPPNRSSPQVRPARSDESDGTHMVADDGKAGPSEPAEGEVRCSVQSRPVRLDRWPADPRDIPHSGLAEVPEASSEPSGSYHHATQGAQNEPARHGGVPSRESMFLVEPDYVSTALYPPPLYEAISHHYKRPDPRAGVVDPTSTPTPTTGDHPRSSMPPPPPRAGTRRRQMQPIGTDSRKVESPSKETSVGRSSKSVQKRRENRERKVPSGAPFYCRYPDEGSAPAPAHPSQQNLEPRHEGEARPAGAVKSALSTAVSEAGLSSRHGDGQGAVAAVEPAVDTDATSGSGGGGVGGGGESGRGGAEGQSSSRRSTRKWMRGPRSSPWK